MDLNGKYQQQCYQQQNIQLRRQVRQLDLRSNYRLSNEPEPNYTCNFLVLGPPKSGKSALLRTLQYALNGSQGWGIRQGEGLKCFEVKRGCRWAVEGVRQVKETDKKYAITGLQLLSVEKASTRYKKALEYVENGLGGCMQQHQSTRQLARVCLVCIDATQQELPYEQATYLKFLKVDLQERHIKTLFLLTKTDLVAQNLSENQKCLVVQNRIAQLVKDLEIKDRQDVYCLQNYVFPQQQSIGMKSSKKMVLNSHHQTVHKFFNDEEINFYALQLLQRIVKESQKSLKLKAAKTSKSWICGWA